MRTAPSPVRLAPEVRRARPSRLPGVSLAASVAGILAFSLAPYPAGNVQALTWAVRPSGWDVYGYAWETAVAGRVPLPFLGAKPGLPVLGALLSGAVPLTPSELYAVLMPVLAVALGLAAAAGTRRALGLPRWSVAVVTVAVATWAGTSRVVVGYQPTLALLVLLAAGVAVMIEARGDRSRLALASLLFLAGCLVHVAEFAAFVGIAGVYGLASLPGFVRDRRAGVPLAATDAGAAAVTILPAAAVGAGALFGWLGLRPSQVVRTSQIGFLFTGRTYRELQAVRAKAVAGLGALGLAAAWTRRLDRRARALLRLGTVWLAATAAAILLSLAGTRVPGARFLLFALPVPVTLGVGIVAVTSLTAGGRGRVRRALGALAAGVLLAAVAVPGEAALSAAVGRSTGPLAGPLRAAAAYLARAGGTRSVVFVDDEPTAYGAFAAKLRLNQIRAGLPAAVAARTFLYMGTARDALAGRPTTLPAGAASWRRTYDANALASWRTAGPALHARAIVLVLRPIARPSYARLLAADPSAKVAPGLLVARGPAAVAAPPAASPFPWPRAALSSLALLALLTLLGAGFARAALARAGWSWTETLCIAPAVGAGIGVLAAFLLAAVGLPPSGPAGPATIAVVAAAGLALALRARGAGARNRLDGAGPHAP